MPAFAAVAVAAAAAGFIRKRASFTSGSWPLGRRSSAAAPRGGLRTRLCAAFAPRTMATMTAPPPVPRHDSGEWSRLEAAFSPQRNGIDTDVAGAPSLWHDVDLHVKSWLDEPTGLLRYVNEMPMGSLKKYEVQPGVAHNAIKEDVKGSAKLAKFGKPVPFNYGCFPQTYRDPSKADELYSAPGDDDPLDVIDLSERPTEVGTIVRCRVLGAVCLIDEGQADWKVLVVNVDSNNSLADARSIQDVERLAPGRIQACWAWMDELKRAGGKGNAKLHRTIHDADCAMKLIEEDHVSWRALLEEAGPDGTARGHWIRPARGDGAVEIFAQPQVLKLGWAPPCVVPGQLLRSPGMLAGKTGQVPVLARAARAVCRQL